MGQNTARWKLYKPEIRESDWGESVNFNWDLIDTQPKFADDETVSGSGTSFALRAVPNPPASLLLFQTLTGFGQVLLKASVDYTLSGAEIETVKNIEAGALSAWYRY